MIRIKKPSLLFKIILFIFFLIIFKTYNDYVGLKIILSAALSYSFVEVGKYVKDSIKKSDIKYILCLILVLFVFYFPLISNGYFFHDDYFLFPGTDINFFKFSLSQGRPIIGNFTDIFYWVTVDTSFILRIISIFGAIASSLLIFLYVKQNSSKKTAIIFSILLVTTIPFVNLVSYNSMFIYTWAIMLSIFSAIQYEQYLSTKNIIHLLNSFICLLVAFLIYQVVTTIAFIIIFLKIVLSKKKDNTFYKSLLYIGLYLLTTITYYLFVKTINSIYSIQFLTRSNFVEIGNVFQKIEWFFQVVIPQSLNQIMQSFTSIFFFNEPYSIGTLSYRHNTFGIVIAILFCLIIIIGFIRIYKIHKNRVFILLLLIPLSYIFFLILEETGFTSYYAVGIVSILMIMLLCGLISIYELFSKSNLFQYGIYLIVLLIVLVGLNNQYYMTSFWLNNSKDYYYLKKTIQLQLQVNPNKINNIHVFGTLFPLDADIYAISAVKLALNDLKISQSEYHITNSNSEYQINTIDASEAIKNKLKELPNEELSKFNKYYEFNKTFGIYILSKGIEKNDIQFFTGLLQKFEIVPKTLEDTLFIYL